MFFVILGLLGGIGLFLYGMYLASESLQKYAASKIKNVLSKLTKTPAKGIGMGIIVTFLFQSSTATSVLLVSLVSAGLMSFPSALALIMGSAIGTTLTVQLIAFRLTDYALLLVAIGAGIFIFSGKKKIKYLGQAILGFGLIFYGMGVMATAMSPLQDNAVFTDVMLELVNRPFLLLLVATAFTAIIQSSAATLAIAMSLAAGGIIPLVAAIPIMLGANIGTTATALLSSLASSREAKRVALAFLIFKVVGAIAIIPFISPFIALVLASSEEVSRQIANAHTFFNIFITLLFFPVIGWFSMLIYKLIPEKEDEVRNGKKVTKFIDKNALDVPDLALWQTKNEIAEMGKLVGNDMLEKLSLCIEKSTDKQFDYLVQKESQVDNLYIAISKYIASLSERDMQEEQSQLQVKYLYVINDLEHIGDIVQSLTRGYQRALDEGTNFSKEDIEDFNAMLLKVKENYFKSLKSFAEDDYELAAEVLKGQPEILKLEKSLRFSHFSRIASSGKKELDGSATYLDMINALLRINSHSVGISQTVMGIV